LKQHGAIVLNEFAAAIRADEREIGLRVAADERKAFRWLLNDVQFDEIGGLDVHRSALSIAEVRGRDEPNDDDYTEARVQVTIAAAIRSLA
jgi:hypothetical protein